MDTVTYPSETVISFIQKNLIPLRVGSDQPLATQYDIHWTPALLILDQSGKEHQRTIGFLSPEDLLPSLLLGIGKERFDENNFKRALNIFEKIMKEYPGNESVAETIYLTGVSRYKSTSNPSFLKEAYLNLQNSYPSSAWTKRAAPYRLL